MVIAAKTADPHPKLPGTIYTAAEESKPPNSILLSNRASGLQYNGKIMISRAAGVMSGVKNPKINLFFPSGS